MAGRFRARFRFGGLFLWRRLHRGRIFPGFAFPLFGGFAFLVSLARCSAASLALRSNVSINPCDGPS
jgi:hypothetical protein